MAISLEWVVAGGLSAIILGLFILLRREAGDRQRMAKLCLALIFDENLYQRKRVRFLHWLGSHPAEDRATLYIAASLELSDLAKRISAPAVSVLLWKIKSDSETTPLQAQSVTSSSKVIGEFRNSVPASPREIFEREEGDLDQDVYVKAARFRVAYLRWIKKLRESFKPKQ
jgi:hypothetical protein